MLTIAACILSGIVVLGFYGYVFSHLYSEHRKMKRLDKYLAEHMAPIGGRREPKAKTEIKQRPRKSAGSFRAEALVNVGVSVAGLTAIFAELEILNRLLNASH
jgi:hypothetical protein